MNAKGSNLSLRAVNTFPSGFRCGGPSADKTFTSFVGVFFMVLTLLATIAVAHVNADEISAPETLWPPPADVSRGSRSTA